MKGLGFDYAGFIWWDDFVWRTDQCVLAFCLKKMNRQGDTSKKCA
jgi:DUF2075 family protein